MPDAGRDHSAGTQPLFRLSTREWRWLLVLAAAGLALRLALIAGARTYVIPPEHEHYQFSHEYGRIARSLALGRGYSGVVTNDMGGPTVAGVPLFPFYLSLLFRVFGIYSPGAAAALLVTNSIASVATVILVFLLGRRLFGERVAWVAAVVFCFDPTPVWYSVNCVWDTALSCFVLTLAPLLFLWIEEAPTIRRAAVAGVLSGISAHLNAGVLLVDAALGVWLVVRSSGRRAKMVRVISAMGAVGAACILPWSLRNSLVLGRPALLRGGGEAVMFVGNHPGATGDTKHDESQAYVTRNHDEWALYHSMGEAAYFPYCQQRAMDFIRSQPAAYARLVLKRTAVFWLGDIWTDVEWKGALRVSSSLSTIKKALGALPIPFVLAGLIIALRRGWAIWPLATQMLAFALPYMLIYCGASRYRVPIHGSLVVLGSLALCAGWDLVRRKGASAAA